MFYLFFFLLQVLCIFFSDIRFFPNIQFTTYIFSCRLCDVAKYNPKGNRKTVKDCLSCTTGSYNDEQGQSACKYNCDAGSYITADKTTCSRCPFGTYQDQDDQLDCKLCKKGSYNDQIESKKETACKPCVRGTYSDIEGIASLLDCKRCAIGTYSDTRRSQTVDNCKGMFVSFYCLYLQN